MSSYSEDASEVKRVQLYVSPLSDVSTWGEEIATKADAVFRELYNEHMQRRTLEVFAVVLVLPPFVYQGLGYARSERREHDSQLDVLRLRFAKFGVAFECGEWPSRDAVVYTYDVKASLGCVGEDGHEALLKAWGMTQVDDPDAVEFTGARPPGYDNAVKHASLGMQVSLKVQVLASGRRRVIVLG